MISYDKNMAAWINGIASFSLILIIGGMVILFRAILTGDFSSMVVKTLVVVSLYIFSMYFISYSLEKGVKIKLYAWGSSAIFHLLLIVYVYFEVKFIKSYPWVLTPEALIFALSSLTFINIAKGKKLDNENYNKSSWNKSSWSK